MKQLALVKRFGWLLLAYAILLMVLFTTDPFRSSLLVVVVPFGLLFVALFMTFNSLWSRPSGQQGFSRKKRLLMAAGAAWLPVMLLILRSIDQLTARDSLILGVFVLALLLYISRTSFIRR